MFNINTRIPGWNREDILTVIADYSSKVKPGGNILELGALFGRTTHAIGNNKNLDVKLTVIDIWWGIKHSNHLPGWYHDKKAGRPETALLERLTKHYPEESITGDDFYLLWQVFTSGIVNMNSIRDLTSIPNESFPEFDLIIHDAAHDYEHVYEDLTNWFPKLKSDGVMIIDDYEPNFTGVIQAVDQYTLENNLHTEMVTDRNILLKRK